MLDRHVGWIGDFGFRGMVVDEAHFIKNRTSQRSQHVLQLADRIRTRIARPLLMALTGTPLINDAFHAGRWDYPFRIKDGKGKVTSSLVSVFFKDGRVSHFEGGDLPSEKDYLQRIAAPK